LVNQTQEVTPLHSNVNIERKMATRVGNFSRLFKKPKANVVGMIHLLGSPGRNISTLNSKDCKDIVNER